MAGVEERLGNLLALSTSLQISFSFSLSLSISLALSIVLLRSLNLSLVLTNSRVTFVVLCFESSSQRFHPLLNSRLGVSRKRHGGSFGHGLAVVAVIVYTNAGIRLGSANPKECFTSTSDSEALLGSGGSNANNQWHGFFKLLKKGPQMPFQPFHPLKKDVSKLSRRKSKRVREDLILSSFDSEFANFKSSWKNFTLSELQAATDDFNHGRDKRPVKSLVVGRPILLALEDIDEGTKVEEILRQSTDVEEHLEDMKQQGGLEKWLKLLQVVESPIDSALILDGALLSAYQYFENVRNFLVAVQLYKRMILM
ncbi:hypothetical protein Ahy_B09g097756 isoform B [Arachis hypogaea]|uniref:Uncharacterized protein n=1 Tax=Arachis hypogaea TaxID=3818 RepID=A0A444XPX8_ARAHY|nr:hypothetical protein Ahy_B09g097756 isoform B [Arachis hypogaea]